MGTKIVADSQLPMVGYDESSGAILYGDAAYMTYHNGGQGLVTEKYGYDGSHRFETNSINFTNQMGSTFGRH